MSSATSTHQGTKAKKANKYYAVTQSPLLEKPTIFESWARAHVVTTGQDAPPKSFESLREAQEYMRKHCGSDFEVLEREESTVTTLTTGTSYYAVAYGRHPGITEIYEGSGGAKDEVKDFKHCCHAKFPTRQQAEEFIEDWKDQYVQVAARRIRLELDENIRPPEIKTKGASLFPSVKSAGTVQKESGNTLLEAGLESLRL